MVEPHHLRKGTACHSSNRPSTAQPSTTPSKTTAASRAPGPATKAVRRTTPSAGTPPRTSASRSPAFLGPAAFPGDAAHLQTIAADNDATEQVRDLLARLADDRTYESVQEALDGLREG